LGQGQKKINFGGVVGKRFFANGDQVGSMTAFDEGRILGITLTIVTGAGKGADESLTGRHTSGSGRTGNFDTKNFGH